MDEFQDYFKCGECGNTKFRPVYSFSLRFRSVNFSDNLVYNEAIEENYECVNCQKTYSKQDIKVILADYRCLRSDKKETSTSHSQFPVINSL